MNTLILIARPVTVEARQYEHVDQAQELARWCKGWTSGTRWEDPRVGMYTDTGQPAYASVGDWVLRGTNGSFYPAPADVVETKYMRPLSAVTE